MVLRKNGNNVTYTYFSLVGKVMSIDIVVCVSVDLHSDAGHAATLRMGMGSNKVRLRVY